MTNKQNFLIRLSICAIVLTLAAFTFTSCSTTRAQAQVSVSGSGTVYLDPDMVSFCINVSETAETTSEAQFMTNTKISMVLSTLRSYGIADADISTTGLSFCSDSSWIDGKYVKTGERVSQTVNVKMRTLDDFPKLADDLGQISGISLYSVSFDCSTKTDAYAVARKMAYEDALNKARAYANEASMSITGPVSINEGYSSSGAVMYASAKTTGVAMTAAVEDTVETETPSGSISVTVNMDAVFSMK